MKAFIIHLSTALEREMHMKKEFGNKGLDIEFINDGDFNDLSETALTEYFTGEMRDNKNAARISNAYKHFLAYDKILKFNHSYAMILEDDIICYNNFTRGLKNIENEIRNLHISNFIISLEDSHLKYVRGSERSKNKYLYPKTRGRTTGAYIIDFDASNNILSYLKSNKCSLHIGWFHNLCSDNKIIQIYWCHPPLVTQGSMNGRIKSLINKNKVGSFRIITYNIQKIYKKLLYWIR